VSDTDTPRRTLRIAAHISASEWGGAERRSLALLAGLVRRGHDVTVFCNTPFIVARAEEAGVSAVISPLRGDLMLRYVFAFARRLRRLNPDVLILVTFRRLLPGGLAGRMAGVPRIMARVGLASDVARRAKYRFVLKHWISDVIVNAQSLVSPFVASLAPGSLARVQAIPNGVECRDPGVTRAAARAALGLPADAFVVGTVARLVRQKRIDRLIRVAHALRADHVHVVIAGAGYERDRLERLAGDLGVTERVHLLGHREDVGVVHRALDIYLVTSTQEGMSSGMLEALAAAVPVISTPVSGAAEVLATTPQCGLVVEADDTAIANAVGSLLHDGDRRRDMSVAAAMTIPQRFGVDRMIDRWEALLLGRTA
jgi:glycosyltransferase involved in cell wall biosynthesis